MHGKLSTSPSLKLLLAVFISCVALRLISLGLYPLMDTTEARYGEITRLMVETGNWLTPLFDYNVPFWGKPPMFAWLSALGFDVFGMNEFAARLPHLLVALAMLWLTYYFTKSHYHSKKLGLFSASILTSTFSFIIIAGEISADTALAFCVTLCMVSFWQVWQGRHPIWGYLFFLGLALGMLSKGPLILVLVGISLTLWLLPNGRWKNLRQVLPWKSGMLLFLIISLPWYFIEEWNSPGFLRYFIMGEYIKRFIISGWNGDLYGNTHSHIRGSIWIYGAVAMLPWTPILIAQLTRIIRSDQDIQENDSGFGSYLLFFLLSPLLLFTFSGNLLVSYVMPALPAMAILLVHYQYHKPISTRYYALGLTTPLVLLFSFSAIHFHYADQHSEKKMISIWKLQDEAKDADFYYYRNRPFSAEYYSDGKAKERSAEKETWLTQQTKPFFIVQPIDSSEHYPGWSCAERTEVEKKVLLYCHIKH